QRRPERGGPALRDASAEGEQEGGEDPGDQEGDPEGGPERSLRGTALPAAVDEGQDEEEDHRDATEQVPPERRAELRLQWRPGPDRELREDVRDLQEAPGEQQVPVRHDQLGQLRAPPGPEERRDERGEEEHHRDEEANRDEVPGPLLREPRTAGRMVKAVGALLPR